MKKDVIYINIDNKLVIFYNFIDVRMKLTNYHKSYLPEDNYINFHKNISEWFWIRSDIYIISDKFVQYQKDLIQEFFADLINNYEFWPQSEPEYQKFIKHFEFAIEDLNSKLSVFGQKVKDIKKLEIRWIIEIIYDKNYVASLIGSSSLVIFRDGKLYFSFDNESENNKIDLFSEFIEWDLHDGDQMVLVGTNLWDIVDDQDLENINELVWLEDKSIIDVFEELLTARVTTDFIKFLQSTDVYISSENIAKNLLLKSSWDILSDSKLFGYINKNKYNISIWLVTILSFLAAIYLIYSFYQQKQWIVLVKEDKTAINFTIQDVQNDISYFQKLDPASSDKIKKYKEINEKIWLLEKNNKLPNDVVNLKKLLQDTYLQSFNISSITTLENKIYSLTQSDVAHLGKSIKLTLWKNNFNIWWTNGSIIWVVSDTVLGNNVKPNSPWVIYKWCNSNIQKNGLYCRDNIDNIYNITKWWVDIVTNKTNKFSSIKDLWVYGNNNMYILTNAYGSGSESISGISIIYRYQSLPANQNSFKEPMKYSFDSSSFDIMPSRLAIDWSFVFWNQKDSSIYQIWRDAKAVVNTRQVSTQWSVEQIAWWFGNDAQIFTFTNSPNIYIWDSSNKSITVYKSTPPKSNDWNQYNYNLTYLFRLNVQIWNDQINDLVITDWLKPEVYVLKTDGIYNIKLYQYLEKYNEKQTT